MSLEKPAFGNVISLQIVAPQGSGEEVLDFKLAVVKEYPVDNPGYCFVSIDKKYFISSIGAGGPYILVIRPYHIREVKDYPEFEFFKFVDLEDGNYEHK